MQLHNNVLLMNIYPVSKSEKNKIEEIEKILKNLSKENNENIYLEITCLASYTINKLYMDR